MIEATVYAAGSTMPLPDREGLAILAKVMNRPRIHVPTAELSPNGGFLTVRTPDYDIDLVVRGQ